MASRAEKHMLGPSPSSRLKSLGLNSEAAPSLLTRENAISFDLPGITPMELRNIEFKNTLDTYIKKRIKRA